MKGCPACGSYGSFIDIRYKGVVRGEDGNYYDVYLSTCIECSYVDIDDSGVE